MQLTSLVVAAATFAVASAQTVKITNTNFSGITVGTPFNITWSGAASDITLKLKNGPTAAQIEVETIRSGLTGSYYVWTPESTLVNGIYNLEIDHDSDMPNYSEQFSISGGLLSSSSVSSATSASSMSSASVTTTITSTAASITTTATSTASTASNGTIANKTASSTTKPSTSGTASSTATTSVPAANTAAQYASPFAFVLLAFAAFAALN